MAFYNLYSTSTDEKWFVCYMSCSIFNGIGNRRYWRPII